MEIKKQQIFEYVTKDNLNTFKEWLSNIKDKKTKAIIHKRITRLKLGLFGDTKNLKNGIFESRIDYGPGYRLYFGKQGDKIIILLYGGSKRSQSSDIKLALKYWIDFKED